MQVLDHGIEVESLELLGVVERLAHRIGQSGIAVENRNVQRVRPPVTVGMRAFSARKRALGNVIHGCLLWWFARKGPRCSRPDSNLRNAFHQVKLTLMIAAIGFSDDKRYAPAAALFRCAGPSWPLRAGGGSMRDLAAGPVDADQGT